jgi:hypothetical protein
MTGGTLDVVKDTVAQDENRSDPGDIEGERPILHRLRGGPIEPDSVKIGPDKIEGDRRRPSDQGDAGSFLTNKNALDIEYQFYIETP